ncbi:MAG: hypothetical protein MRY72_08350, partial [Aquisalinus sp.]|nr:hypothetical protein [Aquisalinus sp.]
DGPAAGHENIWQLLHQAGLTTGNISSMNAATKVDDGSFAMPDPWCTTEHSTPDTLIPLQHFIQKQVQEYTNTDSRNALTTMLSFVRSLIQNGLRPQTAISLARQLGSEKLSNGKTSWRRAMALDAILADVFSYHWHKARPAYATFFLNSTAHYQHAYWRHMEPDAFTNPAPAAEVGIYENAILAGYKNMDGIIGRFMEFERKGVQLVLMTALSQQPFLKYEETGGQKFYRARNINELLAELDLVPTDIRPVMTHQYRIDFATSEALSKAHEILAGITLENERVFDLEVEDNGVRVGCRLNTQQQDDVIMNMNGQNKPFFDVFYQIEETKSGCHHPDGVLWIQTGNHKVHSEKVSILDWLPTVLDHFDIEPNKHMHGHSLRPLIT